MYKLKRKLLSQNFLHSPQLASRLVENSFIAKNDLVLEIGPGKGILTSPLIAKAQHVIAVELDTHYFHFLQSKFENIRNLTLHQTDFLEFPLPRLPYKVFANIPFAIEGQIIRKLIDAPNPPQDCYLVVMKELAYRLAAPYKENQFSVTHKPWFDFSIIHHFLPTDFRPYPNVNTVLFRFTKRSIPLLPETERPRFQKFIATGFGQGLSFGHNLTKAYGKQKAEKILGQFSLPKNTLPNRLSLSQWLELYKE